MVRATLTDSRAAMVALSGKLIKVINCKSKIDVNSGRERHSLVWVPGQSGAEGNEDADDLAANGFI